MTDLVVRVIGRPAPQGSHELGANGHVMHSSKYLDAWRHAVNRDTRQAYVDAKLTRDDMPLIPYPRPVGLLIEHIVQNEQCQAEGTAMPVGVPDVDKLVRATIDGLGEARVFTNDSQVVVLTTTKRRPDRGEYAGAIIKITDITTSRGDQMTQGFEPNGEYRLVLEKVGADGDGDRTWETIVEVTDTPDEIANTWLPSLGRRLAGAEAPAATAAPVAEPAKPRKRAAKAAEPVAEAPAAAEAVPSTPEPAPAPQAPAEAPRPVNPFARG